MNDVIVYIIVSIVQILISALEIAMLLRAVLSWFIMDDNHPLMNFLRMVTEPVILPIRLLFDKMGWFTDSPLDIPFMVTYLILMILSMIL